MYLQPEQSMELPWAAVHDQGELLLCCRVRMTHHSQLCVFTLPCIKPFATLLVLLRTN